LETENAKMVITEEKLTHFECPNCHKKYSSNSNMNRHMKKWCKGSIVIDESGDGHPDLTDDRSMSALEKIIEDQKEQLRQKDETIEKKDDQLLSIFKEGRIVNNLIINSYGNEDLSYLNLDHIRKILKGNGQVVPKLVREIHCNPDHPENMNIFLPNKKNIKQIMCKVGNEWMMRDGKGILKELVYNQMDTIDNIMGNCADMTSSEVKRLQQLSDAEEDDRNKWHDEMHIDIYNNKTLLGK